MYAFQPPVSLPKSVMRATLAGALPFSVSPVIHLNSPILGRSDVEYEVEAAGGAAAGDEDVAPPEGSLVAEPPDAPSTDADDALPDDADDADAEAAVDEADAEADVVDMEAALPDLDAPDDVPAEPADADALADESDTSAVCSFGSTGWNTNRGATYNAKTATRTTAPAAIAISGSFDFFFSAAGFEPPPEDE